MKKRLMLLLAATVFIFSMLIGCAGDGNVAPAAPQGQGAGNQPAAAPATPAAPGEYPTLSLMMIQGRHSPDVRMVEERLSELTRERGGFNVELIIIEIGNWGPQTNLLLAAGDDTLDVFMGGYAVPYATLITNGQVMPLDDLLAPYEAAIRAAISDQVFDSGRVEGVLFGVGRHLDLASRPILNLRADIATQLGLDNSHVVGGLEGVTEIFRRIREIEPDLPIIGPMNGAVNLGDARFDSLGNRNMLGVLGNFGQNTTVESYFHSAEFTSRIAEIEKWRDMNAFMPDFMNVIDTPDIYMPAGRALGNFAASFDTEVNARWSTNNFGVEMVSMFIWEDSVAVTPGMFYCINPNTRNPELAARLIYLMATDREIVHMLTLGIEGVHWQLADDGSAIWADGENPANPGWTQGFSWTMLNSHISTPFNMPPDTFDRMGAANRAATFSNAFGLTFDMFDVADAVSASTNAVMQFRQALESGSAPDMWGMLETFRDALSSAGIDEIVAHQQAQLDAHMARSGR